MSVQTEVRPPAGETEGQKITGEARSTVESTDLTLALATAHHALLVTRAIKGGKIRRRIMLSLDAAQRAAARAEAAGHPATITLVKLVPVGHADLDELEAGDAR